MPQTITLLRANMYASAFGSNTYNYEDVVVKAEDVDQVAGRRYKVTYKGQRTGRDDKHIQPGSLLYRCKSKTTSEELELLGVVVEVAKATGQAQPASYTLEVVPCNPKLDGVPESEEAVRGVKGGPGMLTRRAAARLGVPIADCNTIVAMCGIVRIPVPDQVYANIQAVLSTVTRVKQEEGDQQHMQPKHPQLCSGYEVDAAIPDVLAAKAEPQQITQLDVKPNMHESVKQEDTLIKQEVLCSISRQRQIVQIWLLCRAVQAPQLHCVHQPGLGSSTWV